MGAQEFGEDSEEEEAGYLMCGVGAQWFGQDERRWGIIEVAAGGCVDGG